MKAASAARARRALRLLRVLKVRPWAWGLLALAHVGAALEVQPVATWFYPLAWWSYVAIADGILVRRGAPALLGAPWGPILRLAFASWAFWLLFEAVNLRIANWFYVGVPEVRLLRWLGISLSFATVLPLMRVTERLLAGGVRKGVFRVRPVRLGPNGLRAAQALGAACVVLPLAFPGYAFPLVWGAVPLLLDPANLRAGRASLLGEWSRGSVRRLALLLLAGLVCGVVWEAWNYLAMGRWIYTVPYLDDTKLFEMPPLGFLGFPPLAVAGYVFTVWADGLWRRWGPGLRGTAVVAILVLGLSVLSAMDRHTVAASVPRLDGIAVLDRDARSVLKSHGVHTVQAMAGLSDETLRVVTTHTGLSADTLLAARAWARMARLKGLGNGLTARLWGIGVRGVADLGSQHPEVLAEKLGGDVPERRLAVWVRAARRVSPPP